MVSKQGIRTVLVKPVTFETTKKKDSPKCVLNRNNNQVNLKQLSMLDFVAYEACQRDETKTEILKYRKRI